MAKSLLRTAVEDERIKRSVLSGHTTRGSATLNARMQTIVSVVSAYYGVESYELISRQRPPRIAWPRHVAMHLCRVKTMASTPEIGTFFDRDHTLICYADQSVRDAILVYAAVRQDLATVSALVDAKLSSAAMEQIPSGAPAPSH